MSDESVLSQINTTQSNLPLYLQVARNLYARIKAGQLGADGVLPAERDLASQLKVSRVTLRKALGELERNGFLDKRHGSGTFLRRVGHVEQKLSALTSFTEDMESRRFRVDTKWIDRSVGRATPEETLNLGLRPRELVCRLYRLRLANGEPLALERAVLPAHFIENPEHIEVSLYQYLREHGYTPHRALQRLKASQADAEQAKLLGIKEKDPILYMERRTMLKEGTPLEFVQSYYRGDIYDFIVELHLAP